MKRAAAAAGAGGSGTPRATSAGKKERAGSSSSSSSSAASSSSSSGAAGSGSAAAAPPRNPVSVDGHKSRVLVFAGRGITARFRHLLVDLRTMIPHHKKESKLDSTHNLTVINEIAEAKGCATTLYLEARKKRDLYMWLSATPSGPSVKFHVVNAHTMDELRLTGNCLQGSRPILSFDRSFDDEEGAPHLMIMRELLTRAFAPPRHHPKVQPFHDRVINIGYSDSKLWFRHYQIVDKAADPTDAKEIQKMLAAGEQPTVLVEIGPRFVLDPVRIFAGSFGGATLWSNDAYVSPNAVRQELALQKAAKYTNRITAVTERKERQEELVLPRNPADEIFENPDLLAKDINPVRMEEDDEDDEDDDEDEDEDDDELDAEDDFDGEFDDDDDDDEDEEDEEDESEDEAPPTKKGAASKKAPAAAAAPAPSASKKARKMEPESEDEEDEEERPKGKGKAGSAAAAAKKAPAAGAGGKKKGGK